MALPPAGDRGVTAHAYQNLPANTHDERQLRLAGDVVVAGLLGVTALLDLASLGGRVLLGVLLSAQEVLADAQLNGLALDQAALGEGGARRQHLLGGLQLRLGHGGQLLGRHLLLVHGSHSVRAGRAEMGRSG